MSTSARLIAVTKPVIEEITEPEEVISFAARVSNPANQANTETAPKLLRYLGKKAHWSPFEMAHMVVEIKTTRAIAHQILRHRSFAFQEFSQRYAAQLEPMIFSKPRLQDAKNRQASHETEDEALTDWWMKAQFQVAELTSSIYQEALQRGIAKEVARNVLPEGMTPSTLYMAGTVRSFIHYCKLRCDMGTQLEHRLVGEAVLKVLLATFPSIAEQFAEEQ